MLIMYRKVQFLGLISINCCCGNEMKNKTKIVQCWKSSKCYSDNRIEGTIDTLDTRSKPAHISSIKWKVDNGKIEITSFEIQRSYIYYGHLYFPCFYGLSIRCYYYSDIGSTYRRVCSS